MIDLLERIRFCLQDMYINIGRAGLVQDEIVRRIVIRDCAVNNLMKILDSMSTEDVLEKFDPVIRVNYENNIKLLKSELVDYLCRAPSSDHTISTLYNTAYNLWWAYNDELYRINSAESGMTVYDTMLEVLDAFAMYFSDEKICKSIKSLTTMIKEQMKHEEVNRVS
ncbi:MAG: hypothetical protein BPH43C_14 [Phage 5P_1]|nr:MAG: hypothetical protein BPH43C_14 [Phage 5P_1]